MTWQTKMHRFTRSSSPRLTDHCWPKRDGTRTAELAELQPVVGRVECRSIQALSVNEISYTVYPIEIAAIVPFGLFWFIKTAEISLSEFDRKIEEGVALPQPMPTDIGGNKA